MLPFLPASPQAYYLQMRSEAAPGTKTPVTVRGQEHRAKPEHTSTDLRMWQDTRSTVAGLRSYNL